ARVVNTNRLTEETAEAIGREFEALAAARATPSITLDLGAVEFLSSVALTQLIGLNRTVRAGGGRLVVTNLRPEIRKVIVLTRLDRLLEIDPPAQTLAS